jgi:hypothetical protein
VFLLADPATDRWQQSHGASPAAQSPDHDLAGKYHTSGHGIPSGWQGSHLVVFPSRRRGWQGSHPDCPSESPLWLARITYVVLWRAAAFAIPNHRWGRAGSARRTGSACRGPGCFALAHQWPASQKPMPPPKPKAGHLTATSAAQVPPRRARLAPSMSACIVARPAGPRRLTATRRSTTARSVPDTKNRSSPSLWRKLNWR